jgi:hypothetical protein
MNVGELIMNSLATFAASSSGEVCIRCHANIEAAGRHIAASTRASKAKPFFDIFFTHPYLFEAST